MALNAARIYLLTAAGTKVYALDPVHIEDALRSRRLPSTFTGKANSYLATIDGPGRGWILIKRSELDALDLSLKTYSLVFEVVGAPAVTISKLFIKEAVAVSGTQNERPTDIFLLELRDHRDFGEFTAVNNGYNVRTPDWVSTTSRYTNSLLAGVAATWATLVADLWTNISGVTGSTLTVTLAAWPDFGPENFQFYGCNAFQALEQICQATNNRLIVKRDGTFHVVSEGDADVANAAVFAANTTETLNPSDPTDHDGTSVPAVIRVFFPKRYPAFQNSTDAAVVTGTDQWHQDPTHSIDVNATVVVPALTHTIASAVAPIYDSLPALYSELGTLQNGANLQTQAEARALRFVQSRRQDSSRNDIYRRAVPFNLGATVAAIHWYDFGDGIRTQVFSSPKKIGPTGQRLDSTINEWPAMPDLARWHLPRERWVVGEVYGSDIAADNSGIVRVLYGTQTSGTVTSWAETGLPHEVRAHDVTHSSYKIGDRVIAFFHTQTSRWLIAKGSEARYGEAILIYDMCTTGTHTIYSYTAWIGSTDTPVAAVNPFNHKGMAGDIVFVVWSNSRNAYVIVDVKKHDYKVFTDLRQVGDCEEWCVEGLAVTAALEVCAEPAWETVYCNPCGTYPSTSTSGEFVPIQTSTNLSVPTYGCCIGEYPHVANDLGIIVYDEVDYSYGWDGGPLSPLYVTITDITTYPYYPEGYPSPLYPGYYSYVVSPRSANVNSGVVPLGVGVPNVNLTHPDDPGPYSFPISETWKPSCVRRTDPLTGALMFPDDPSQREWVLEGRWDISGSGGLDHYMIIYETGRAVLHFRWGTGFYRREITGSLTVHSCNPFHATASFSIPSSVTTPVGDPRYLHYPTGFWYGGPGSTETDNMGPFEATIEITE